MQHTRNTILHFDIVYNTVQCVVCTAKETIPDKRAFPRKEHTGTGNNHFYVVKTREHWLRNFLEKHFGSCAMRQTKTATN